MIMMDCLSFTMKKQPLLMINKILKLAIKTPKAVL